MLTKPEVASDVWKTKGFQIHIIFLQSLNKSGEVSNS